MTKFTWRNKMLQEWKISLLEIPQSVQKIKRQTFTCTYGFRTGQMLEITRVSKWNWMLQAHPECFYRNNVSHSTCGQRTVHSSRQEQRISFYCRKAPRCSWAKKQHTRYLQHGLFKHSTKITPHTFAQREKHWTWGKRNHCEKRIFFSLRLKQGLGRPFWVLCCLKHFS